MKKIAALLVLTLAMGAYSYFFIFVPEEKKMQAAQSRSIIPDDRDPVWIHLTNGELQIKLKKKEDMWWVESPNEYLADQEYIGKSIEVMKQTPAVEDFFFEEDRFGLIPGKAIIALGYENGLNKRLVVGSESAPQSNIYVLDKDSNRVSVVHNVWGQLVYYGLDRFYSGLLPLPGKHVKTIAYKEAGKVMWRLSSIDAKNMKIEYQGDEFSSEKSQWIWFFRKLRDLSLSQIKFDQKLSFKVASELEVDTEKGNIIFLFNKKGDKIFAPKLNVFAHIEVDSLKSLSDEINKVMNSDKK